MSDHEMYGELEVQELTTGKKKTRVCLIYTGGTIGMVPSDPKNPESPLRPASLEELLEAVEGLGEREGIELGMVSFKQPVDSSDVSSKHWVAIATAIEEHYDSFDGFVVLHGTDTMAFTTSALSFLLNNLAKPVVVTGSQLPIIHPRTEAVMNLTSAVHIAGYKAVNLPRVPEVTLSFLTKLLRGNRVTKVSSTQLQGFDSPNFPPLGELGEHIVIRKDLLRPSGKAEDSQFFADKKLADDLKIILVNPGLTPEQLERDLHTDGLEGVILLTYGAGNMPTSPEFVEVIREAVRGGEHYSRPLVVMNVTQCLEGNVEMGLYEASSGLLEAGVTSGLDMTLEAAIAKMYWAVKKFKGRDIHTQLQVAHRGEQTENFSDLAFDPGKAKSSRTAVNQIQTEPQLIPGHYARQRLTRALVRVHGLGLDPEDSPDGASLRIFINATEADETTSLRTPAYVAEIPMTSLSQDGNVVRSATDSARSVVNEGQPVSITLVGIKCRLWCRSIHVGLYTEAD